MRNAYQGNTKGGSITVPLTSCLTGMTTDNFCFYLQYRLIQTSQTGGQLHSDTSPLVFPDLSNDFRAYDFSSLTQVSLNLDCPVQDYTRITKVKNVLSHMN